MMTTKIVVLDALREILSQIMKVRCDALNGKKIFLRDQAKYNDTMRHKNFCRSN